MQLDLREGWKSCMVPGWPGAGSIHGYFFRFFHLVGDQNWIPTWIIPFQRINSLYKGGECCFINHKSEFQWIFSTYVRLLLLIFSQSCLGVIFCKVKNFSKVPSCFSAIINLKVQMSQASFKLSLAFSQSLH